MKCFSLYDSVQLHTHNQMPTPQKLKSKMLLYYLKMIREKKITFKTLEGKLPYMLRDKILSLLVEDGRCYYRNNHYQNLKTELMIATAVSVEINEDMRVVHDIDGCDRELVRDVYIQYQEPRQMFAILDTDEYEEPDDINIMSDSREELESYTFNGELPIVEIFVDFYRGINEYEHPSWERIYKFVEKYSYVYDHSNLSEEPYDERYSDF